ncbi:kinase-like protein [Ramaria rubella]|nr:kinase-like protein [Ramaria rubella]
MRKSIPNHLVGKRVSNNRIELVSLLGEGSFGAVYRGLIHRGGINKPKQCAVKVLQASTDEGHLLCQRRELELHQRVSGGNGIVTLYESFKEGEYRYLVMKFCPNRDLWHSICNRRFLGNDRLIKDIFLQVLDAIDYCHSHSVFHRDVKPENILLCNGGRKALLSDFGLAIGDHVSTELRTGSPWYMSPECFATPSRWGRRYATAPNDIWSLGVLLLNLASGKHAPWMYAHPNDRFFHDFLKQPNLLRLFVPLSLDVHDILTRVFTINPVERISIKELKAAVQKVKHFSIPPSRLTEYYNYQCAVWSAAVATPTLPRTITAIPTVDDRLLVSKPTASAKIKTITTAQNSPPAQSTLTFSECRRTTLPLRMRSTTSSSSLSSVDSDGPATPEMHPVLSNTETLEIDFCDPARDNTSGFLLPPSHDALVPLSTSKEANNSTSSAHSWQTILDIMNAW